MQPVPYLPYFLGYLLFCVAGDNFGSDLRGYFRDIQDAEEKELKNFLICLLQN